MDQVFRQLIAKRSAVQEDTEKQSKFQTKAGRSIIIQEDPNGGVGGSVWEANLDLLECIQDSERFPKGFFEDTHVVELGAGTGLAGLLCASLGARVTLTDRVDVLDLLRLNVRLNQSLFSSAEQVGVQELEWGKTDCSTVVSESGKNRILIAAECIYNLLYGDVLLETMLSLCLEPGTLVLFSYAQRNAAKEKVWFEKVAEHFLIEEVSNSSAAKAESVDATSAESKDPIKIVLVLTKLPNE